LKPGLSLHSRQCQPESQPQCGPSHIRTTPSSVDNNCLYHSQKPARACHRGELQSGIFHGDLAPNEQSHKGGSYPEQFASILDIGWIVLEARLKAVQVLHIFKGESPSGGEMASLRANERAHLSSASVEQHLLAQTHPRERILEENCLRKLATDCHLPVSHSQLTLRALLCSSDFDNIPIILILSQWMSSSCPTAALPGPSTKRSCLAS